MLDPYATPPPVAVQVREQRRFSWWAAVPVAGGVSAAVLVPVLVLASSGPWRAGCSTGEFISECAVQGAGWVVAAVLGSWLAGLANLLLALPAWQRGHRVAAVLGSLVGLVPGSLGLLLVLAFAVVAMTGGGA